MKGNRHIFIQCDFIKEYSGFDGINSIAKLVERNKSVYLHIASYFSDGNYYCFRGADYSGRVLYYYDKQVSPIDRAFGIFRECGVRNAKLLRKIFKVKVRGERRCDRVYSPKKVTAYR